MERLLKTQDKFAFAATAAMAGQTVRVLVEAAGRTAGTVSETTGFSRRTVQIAGIVAATSRLDNSAGNGRNGKITDNPDQHENDVHTVRIVQ